MCAVRQRTSLNNSDVFFQTKNQKENLCLDNNEYLFLGPEKLTVKDCNYEPETQVWNQMKKAGVNIVNGFLDRKLAVCFVWIENNWTIAKKKKKERKAMFKVEFMFCINFT